MKHKSKNAVVLFVTLMLIMLLLSIVNIFLSKTQESKDDVTKIFAIMQTNLMMHNIFNTINEIEFDEFTIFMASKMSIPLNFGMSNVTFQLNSAQKLININSLVMASIEDNLINDKLYTFFTQYDLKKPNLLIEILQDTIDQDTESRSSDESEIINITPVFKNTRIYNKKHLEIIKDYYFDLTADKAIYTIPFEKFFDYSNTSIDLNFLTPEIMELIFDDANQYILQQIQENESIYESLDDIPFDEYYREKINKGIMGQTFTVTTTDLLIHVNINYKSQFTSKVSFLYNIKSKKVYEYSIHSIKLHKEL